MTANFHEQPPLSEDTTSTHQSVRIATAQYPFHRFDTADGWRRKLSQWVEEGAATGADILLFPEYAALEQAAHLGDDVLQDLDKTMEAVTAATAERVALHASLATQHDVFIVAGSGPVTTPDGDTLNAAQFIAPSGAIGEQAKVIMTPFEREWGISGAFECGEPLRVFDTPFARVGILICYDVEFPLLARALCEAGAEILLVPSCTEFESGWHRVRTGARARSLENQIAAITSPTVGEAAWSPVLDVNNGAAGIFVPPDHGLFDSGLVREGTINAPGWVVGEVPLSRLRHLRTSGEMRNYIDWSAQFMSEESRLDLPDVEIVTLR